VSYEQVRRWQSRRRIYSEPSRIFLRILSFFPANFQNLLSEF
jgi:hypothetical protein